MTPCQPCVAPRILIVRLSSVGDVLHGLPVLCALRDRFPEAHLGWVVEDRAAGLLEGHGALDELIVVPRGWWKSPAALWRLRQRLRASRFEIAVDVQGLTKSALAARLSGARRRIGFDGEKGREFSRWLNNERVVSTAAHIIDSNLELLRPLGVERPNVRFDVPQRAVDAITAGAIIAQAGLVGGYAILNPGAGWVSKLWPTERYAAVARHLGRQCGLPSLIVWGGSREEELARQIVVGAVGHAALAPRTSLRELAELERRAQLFVGSDTGPLHLAVAVGTPCVGLYGPMPASRNGPYGPQHVALQKRHFEGTSRQRRGASREYMEAIDVESVCQACDAVLARRGWKAAA